VKRERIIATNYSVEHAGRVRTYGDDAEVIADVAIEEDALSVNTKASIIEILMYELMEEMPARTLENIVESICVTYRDGIVRNGPSRRFASELASMLLSAVGDANQEREDARRRDNKESR
jgi:hypothetical protein